MIKPTTEYQASCDYCFRELGEAWTSIEDALFDAMGRASWRYCPTRRRDVIECHDCRAKRELATELTASRTLAASPATTKDKDHGK